MKTWSIRLMVSALVVLVLASQAAAQDLQPVRPFQGRVVAQWDQIFAALPPSLGAGLASFAGRSQVTHMGRALQSGTLSLQAPVAPNVFPGTGSVLITAANGDTLRFNYEGLLFAATGEGKGTFTFTGGTGRFTGATGNGTFYALIDLTAPVNQPMTIRLDGRIRY